MNVDPTIVSQKTPIEEMAQIILSDKTYLVTQSVEEQLVLMSTTRDYFVKYSSSARVVKELVTKNKIKESTAWKLVQLTPKIFSIYLQELGRNFLVDIHLQKVEETYRIAKEMNDPKSMALADRNRHAAIKEFCGTNSAIDQSKLHLPDIQTGYHTELFKDIPDINTLEYKKIMEGFRHRKDKKKQIEEQEFTDYEEVD